MTTRSNLGVDWITTKGLPSGYYQNGSEIGSSVYLKPTQTVTPAYTGLLTTIPTGSVGLNMTTLDLFLKYVMEQQIQHKTFIWIKRVTLLEQQLMEQEHLLQHF